MRGIQCAVIACAGFGSRLGMGMPKCMVEINGKTLLTRLIEGLRPLVPRIHVVVGYKSEIVTDYCSSNHCDVYVVHNRDYFKNNTADSIALGSDGVKGKVLYLDGDLIIDPASLRRFVERANEVDLLVGVTRSKSSEAVFVQTDDDSFGNPVSIVKFQREPPLSWEWANIFSSKADILNRVGGFVYERIEPRLPAEAKEIELCEIDTLEDFHSALGWVKLKGL